MSDRSSAALDDVVYFNRQEIADLIGVTVVTIDRWIAAGMPVEETGGNGRPYRIDPEAVISWRKDRDAEEQKRAEAVEQRKRDLQDSFDLRGGSAEGADALNLSERARYYEAEAQRIKVAKLRGELIEVSRLQVSIDRLFGFLADQIQALPDRLERDCGLPPEAVELVVKTVNEWQEQLADDTATMITADD